MTPCAECGFDYDLAGAAEVSVLARDYARAYAELLRAEPSVLRQRTAAEVWSPLEYACHMRDVLLVQRERVLAARRRDEPVAEPMGRDERVEHDGYAEQQPADVARQLQDATLLFAHVLDRLSPTEWERTLVYTYPEREQRSLRWVAAHTLHELCHHLLDIRRQLEHAVNGTRPISSRFFVLLWAHPGAEDALVAYEDKVLGLVPEHGGRVLQRARSDGAAGRPVEIQLLEFPSAEALDAYKMDPRRTALASERDRAIAKTELIKVQLTPA